MVQRTGLDREPRRDRSARRADEARVALGSDLRGEISVVLVIIFQPVLHGIDPRPGVRQRDLVGDEAAHLRGRIDEVAVDGHAAEAVASALDDGDRQVRARAAVDEFDRGRADLCVEITFGEIETLYEVGALLHVGINVGQILARGREPFAGLADDVLLEVRDILVVFVAREPDVAEDDERSFIHFEDEVFVVEDGVAGADEGVAVFAVVEFEEKSEVIGCGGTQAVVLDRIEGIKECVAQVGLGKARDALEINGHVARLGGGGRAFLVLGFEESAGGEREREDDEHDPPRQRHPKQGRVASSRQSQIFWKARSETQPARNNRIASERQPYLGDEAASRPVCSVVSHHRKRTRYLTLPRKSPSIPKSATNCTASVILNPALTSCLPVFGSVAPTSRFHPVGEG